MKNYRLAYWRGSALKAPLCKGSWHGVAVTEGLLQQMVTNSQILPENS